MAENGHIINEQGAMRRGLLMGLTLAEVLILILFALLLLITREFMARDELREVSDEFGLLGGGWREIVKYKEVVHQLNDLGANPERIEESLSRLNHVDPANFDDFFDTLTLAETDNKGLSEQLQSTLQENKNLKDSQKQLAAAVEDLTSRSGAGYPSCWYGERGKQIYLWSVGMFDDGLVILDRPDLEQIAVKKSIGLGPVPYGIKISGSEFDKWARKALIWSKAQGPECRFFVVAYDLTGANKAIYKSYLHQHVEGHFYKLLVSTGAEKDFLGSGVKKFFGGPT